MQHSFLLCLVVCLALVGCKSAQTDNASSEFYGWVIKPDADGKVLRIEDDRHTITCGGNFLVKKPGGILSSILYFGACNHYGNYKLCFESAEMALVKTSLLISHIDIIDDRSPQPIFTPTLVRVGLNQGPGMDRSTVLQKARRIADGSLTQVRSKSDFAAYLIAILQDSTGSIPELPVDDTHDTEDLRKYAWYHKDVTLVRFLAKSHPEIVVE